MSAASPPRTYQFPDKRLIKQNMDNSVCLCIVCKKKVPRGNKKFCSEKCYFKNQVDVARVRRQSKPKEVEIFPIWICDNGHRQQLDFNPTRDKKKWDEHVCPDCITDEDRNENIKVMII